MESNNDSRPVCARSIKYAYVKYTAPCANKGALKHPDKETVDVERIVNFQPDKIRNRAYRVRCGKKGKIFCRATVSLVGASVEEIQQMIATKRVTHPAPKLIKNASEASSASELENTKKKKMPRNAVDETKTQGIAEKKLANILSRPSIRTEQYRTGKTMVKGSGAKADAKEIEGDGDSGFASAGGSDDYTVALKAAANVTKKPSKTSHEGDRSVSLKGNRDSKRSHVTKEAVGADDNDRATKEKTKRPAAAVTPGSAKTTKKSRSVIGAVTPQPAKPLKQSGVGHSKELLMKTNKASFEASGDQSAGTSQKTAAPDASRATTTPAKTSSHSKIIPAARPNGNDNIVVVTASPPDKYSETTAVESAGSEDESLPVCVDTKQAKYNVRDIDSDAETVVLQDGTPLRYVGPAEDAVESSDDTELDEELEQVIGTLNVGPAADHSDRSSNNEGNDNSESREVKLAAEVTQLRMENRLLKALNFKMQRTLMINSKQVKATISNVNTEARHDVRQRICAGEDLDVGFENNITRMVHAGFGFWIKSADYHSLRLKPAINPSKFMANIARYIFTDDVLKRSSITGKVSNAHRYKNGHRVAAKPPLESKGLDAVAAITRHWMMKHVKADEGKIITELNRMTTVISKKISELNRRPKPKTVQPLTLKSEDEDVSVEEDATESQDESSSSDDDDTSASGKNGSDSEPDDAADDNMQQNQPQLVPDKKQPDANDETEKEPAEDNRTADELPLTQVGTTIVDTSAELQLQVGVQDEAHIERGKRAKGANSTTEDQAKDITRDVKKRKVAKEVVGDT